MSTTVWAYVDTSKQVGDAEHIKVLQTPTLQKFGSWKTILKALHSNMT